MSSILKSIGSIGKTAGKFIGNVANNSVGNIGSMGINIGKAAWSSQQYIGEATIKVAKFGADEAFKVGSVFNKATEKMINKKDAEYVFNKKTGKIDEKNGGYSLSKIGWGIVAGDTAYNGFSGALDTYNQENQGNTDQFMTNATPHIDDASATGDLVFALHNNRRG